MKLIKTIDTADNAVVLEIVCNNIKELNEVKSLTNMLVCNPNINVIHNQDGAIVSAAWNTTDIIVITMLATALENYCINKVIYEKPMHVELESKV